MLKVVLHGQFRRHLKPEHRKGIMLSAATMQEVHEALDQYLPFKKLLDVHPSEFRFGDTLKKSNPMPLTLVANGLVDTEMTIHIVPGTGSGHEITTAMIVTALVSAAVSIGISLLMALLFPPEVETNDKRKSKLYENGLNTNKEDVLQGYIAGEEVFCGFNVIEGDVDIIETGGLMSHFSPGPGYTGGGLDAGNSGYGGIRDLLDKSGAFGGGGGKTISNNSFSNAMMKVLGCPGVGPIGGLVGNSTQEKETSIWINEIRYRDKGSGQVNFPGFTWEERTGVPTQDACKITPGISNTFDRSIEVKYQNASGTPQRYPEQVTDANVDRIKIRVNLVLVKTSKKGNQSNTNVEFGVDIRREDGEWLQHGVYDFFGKSSEPFQREMHVFAPPKDPTNPERKWEFRIYRLTSDSDDDKLQNQTTFKGWTETQDRDRTYAGVAGVPDSALFAFSIDASQFDSTSPPEVGLLLAGTIVRVPSNYVNGHDPLNGSSWDGTWTQQVTSNPVWHWFNLATNEVYGAGIPETYFNRYSLYQVAKYCDEFLSYKLGDKTEQRRRFQINKQFTDEQDVWAMLTEFAQSFRATPYWDGASIALIQDRPPAADETAVTNVFINNSQVENGLFLYKPMEQTDQINVAKVEWDNPNDFWRKAIVEYRDEESITSNKAKGLANGGRVEKTVYKIGCTNRAEATDFARALVYAARHEQFSVTFNMSLTACNFRPGDIVGIDDYNISGKAPLGRVWNIQDKDTIILDTDVDLLANNNYQVVYTKNDGSTASRNLFLPQGKAKNNLLALSDHDAMWDTPIFIRSLEDGAAQPTLWRIISINESDETKYEVTAQEYKFSKFAFLEQGIVLEDDTWTNLNPNVPMPENLRAKGYSDQDDLLATRHNVEINWDSVAGPGVLLQGYTLECLKPGESVWTELYRGSNTTFTMRNVTFGTYLFTVKSINTLGRSSAPQRLTFNYTEGGAQTVLPPVFISFD